MNMTDFILTSFTFCRFFVGVAIATTVPVLLVRGLLTTTTLWKKFSASPEIWWIYGWHRPFSILLLLLPPSFPRIFFSLLFSFCSLLFSGINCIRCQNRLRDLTSLVICRKRMFHKLNYDAVNMKHDLHCLSHIATQLYTVWSIFLRAFSWFCSRCLTVVFVSCWLITSLASNMWLVGLVA